jgi:hypothetical protein
MHPIQDLFLEGFSYALQIDMHFICTPMWTKFYSCEKWVLQNPRWIRQVKASNQSNTSLLSYLLVFLVLLIFFTLLCCFEEKSNRFSLTRQGLTLFHASHQVFVRTEWSEHSRLARLAEALVHAPMTTDRKTHRSLHRLCHRRTGSQAQAVILHMMAFQQLRTVMTSPSAPLKRWRSTSPSTVESLLTLVSMMWAYVTPLVSL